MTTVSSLIVLTPAWPLLHSHWPQINESTCWCSQLHRWVQPFSGSKSHLCLRIFFFHIHVSHCSNFLRQLLNSKASWSRHNKTHWQKTLLSYRTFFEVLINGLLMKVLGGDLCMVNRQAQRWTRSPRDWDQPCLPAAVFNTSRFTVASPPHHPCSEIFEVREASDNLCKTKHNSWKKVKNSCDDLHFSYANISLNNALKILKKKLLPMTRHATLHLSLFIKSEIQKTIHCFDYSNISFIARPRKQILCV